MYLRSIYCLLCPYCLMAIWWYSHVFFFWSSIEISRTHQASLTLQWFPRGFIHYKGDRKDVKIWKYHFCPSFLSCSQITLRLQERLLWEISFSFSDISCAVTLPFTVQLPYETLHSSKDHGITEWNYTPFICSPIHLISLL